MTRRYLRAELNASIKVQALIEREQGKVGGSYFRNDDLKNIPYGAFAKSQVNSRELDSLVGPIANELESRGLSGSLEVDKSYFGNAIARYSGKFSSGDMELNVILLFKKNKVNVSLNEGCCRDKIGIHQVKAELSNVVKAVFIS